MHTTDQMAGQTHARKAGRKYHPIPARELFAVARPRLRSKLIYLNPADLNLR